MKTDELTALGLTEEQATKVLAMNGKDIEKHKKQITTLETERDDLKTRLETAETTLKGFDGINPEKIKEEIDTYKQRAADAEKNFTAQLTKRDQTDWINSQLDKFGVKSPFARRQLTADAMAEGSGLTWKDGTYVGFSDFMKSAKEKDKDLYMTDEEKAEAEKNAGLKGGEPKFTGGTGGTPPTGKKYVPPKIF